MTTKVTDMGDQLACMALLAASTFALHHVLSCLLAMPLPI
jgi:hypothetical protein